LTKIPSKSNDKLLQYDDLANYFQDGGSYMAT